jgi:histidine triad (HIT) family protein
MHCIFCSIIKKEIKSDIVYEDNYTIAFLDIAPVSSGHILIVPKLHFANLEEVDELMLAYVMRSAKKLAAALTKGLKVSGYNIVVNNGAVAGQVIDHFHLHLIPRRKDDGLVAWPQNKYQAAEAASIAKKISSLIKS